MPLLASLRTWARRIKRDAVTLWFASRHPAMPWLPKVVGIVAVAYALSPIDLIPDFIPILGYLDDVILLELAWPAVATEAEDYADFCVYRIIANPEGDGAQRREAWIRDRLEALALYQQHERINASRYVDGRHHDRPFRVA